MLQSSCPKKISHLQLCDSQVCPVDEVGNCEVEILAACGMVTSGGYSTASGAASPEIPGGLGSSLQGLGGWIVSQDGFPTQVVALSKDEVLGCFGKITQMRWT